MKQRGREEYLRKREAELKMNQKVEPQLRPPPNKRNLNIKRMELSIQQQEILTTGGYIFLENRTAKDGKAQFSAYAFTNEEKNKVFFSKKNTESLK